MKSTNPRRWIRRGLWSVLVLTILLTVAHRPILRVILDRLGRHLASQNGYTLEWNVRGSVLSDLSIQDIRLEGPTGAPLQLIQIRKATVDFSLWRFFRQGVGRGISDITLTDAQIEWDLRPNLDRPPKKPSATLPDFWLPRVNIQNLSAHILTSAGDVMVQGFSLNLDEAKTGALAIAELSLPAPNLHFTNVRGVTAVSDRTVILSDVVITPEVVVSRFSVDLQNLQTGSMPFEMAIQSGVATLDTSGQLDRSIDGPSLDLTFSMTNLKHSEIERWVKLPSEVSWVIDSAAGQVKGLIADPQKLDAKLTLAASDMTAGGMHFDHLGGRASMTHGKVSIEAFDLQMNDLNHLSLKGSLELANRQHVDVTWNAIIGDLPSISLPSVVEQMQVTARKVSVAGTAEFDSSDLKTGKFDAITSQITAEIDELSWQQRQVENTTLEFRLHNGLAVISKLDLRVDPQNHVSISGDIPLDETQHFNLRWEIDLINLAVVAPWFGVQDTFLPNAGSLTFSGSSSGAVAELRNQNFKSLKTDGSGRLSDFVWQDAHLELAEWEVSCHDGRVDVQKLAIRLNELNELTATGHAMLDKSGEFDAELNGRFEQLADFSGWMDLAKQPRITSGRASLSWTGGGSIAEREITGSGSLNITDLMIEGREDIFALALETKHAGHRAEITKLHASTGKFRTEASMVITDTDLKIAQLVLFSGKTRLIDGSADLPLALTQTPRPALPLDRTRPLKVHLHINKMQVQSLFAVIGQQSPVTGYAQLDFNLDGTLTGLKGHLSATLSEAQSTAMKDKLVPALVKLDAILADRMLTIKASMRQKPLQTLTVNAELPVDMEEVIAAPHSFLNAPLTAHVVLPASDLSIVQRFVPALAAINGTASVDARLSGTLRKPEWQGTVIAKAESAIIKNSDIDIRDVKIRGTFTGQRLVFDDVSTMVSGGEIRINGGMDLTQVTDPKLDLKLAVKQALLFRNDTMSLRADGNLTCIGSLTKAEVAGRVELVRGRVFKEIEFLPLSFPDQLPPRLANVSTASKTPSSPALFSDWTFNVDIVTGEPIRLLGNVLNGRAMANLHLSGTGAEPMLEGKISQQDARLKLPFSRLQLTRGDIIFTKDRPFDPQIDLQGDSMVENTHVTVYATGAAAKPTLRFTSSPPLSEPEIATLLATGTTSGDAQSASGVAANRAAFLVLSQAYRKVFGKRKTSRNDEEDEPGRTTFSFNPLTSQSSSSNLTGSYEITPNLQAEVGLGERGFRGMLSYLIRIR